MEWLNVYGILIVVIIMIPNIILARTNPEAFSNPWHNRFIEAIEQAGRFGCMGFMVFNIPGICFALPLGERTGIYLAVNGILLVVYLLGWVIFSNKDTVAKALLLSAVPTLIFLFSGICILSLPLIICAVIFGIGHITLSVKNCICRIK